MKYNKILVALDRSVQSSNVLQNAFDLAEANGSQLMLFHCINQQADYGAIPLVATIGDIDIYGSLQKSYREKLQKEIEITQSWLEDCSQQAKSRNIPVEFVYEIGEASKAICDLAKSWGADLVLLGRRGNRGISEILLGSVSNYVLHHAVCSVLIVQDKLIQNSKHKASARQTLR
jgi:nucleotide-binding universal stress UspA family protein